MKGYEKLSVASMNAIDFLKQFGWAHIRSWDNNLSAWKSFMWATRTSHVWKYVSQIKHINIVKYLTNLNPTKNKEIIPQIYYKKHKICYNEIISQIHYKERKICYKEIIPQLIN